MSEPPGSGPVTATVSAIGVVPDAWAVARYTADNLERLEGLSQDFRRAMFGSTLPSYVIDAVTATITVIRSNTCIWLEDGRFLAWEGCFDEGGCCEGTCTHVWNYAQTAAFLFPELERAMRRNEYLVETEPDGKMNFRSYRPWGMGGHDHAPAADGQTGDVEVLQTTAMVLAEHLVRLAIFRADPIERLPEAHPQMVEVLGSVHGFSRRTYGRRGIVAQPAGTLRTVSRHSSRNASPRTERTTCAVPSRYRIRPRHPALEARIGRAPAVPRRAGPAPGAAVQRPRRRHPRSVHGERHQRHRRARRGTPRDRLGPECTVRRAGGSSPRARTPGVPPAR